MELGLEGKAVLVTGASGGIGTAITRAFAAEGARVAVHYHRNRDAAQALASEVGGVALQADLREEWAVDRLVPDAVAAFGRLDACVANAGVWPEDPTPVWKMSLDRWTATLDANLTASFLTARAYLRHAASVAEGSLVFIASTAGQFGEAGHADYAAAKSAIAYGLVRSLKNEVVHAAPGARVNCVAPGWTVSPMTADALSAEVVDQVTATMPLRKVAVPQDVAGAAVFLSSSVAAGHLTGQIITVAGGMEGRRLW